MFMGIFKAAKFSREDSTYTNCENNKGEAVGKALLQPYHDRKMNPIGRTNVESMLVLFKMKKNNEINTEPYIIRFKFPDTLGDAYQ